MRIPEAMLWPIKLLIGEKPHLFSRKTKKQLFLKGTTNYSAQTHSVRTKITLPISPRENK